ncbi:hypothetical protein [Cryobacterium sp. TMT4-10]|uniref:hypothetical protein n=1 Tax=Cryobacterium sp. TMT4-10 TaxID=1259256 RepID=UPI0010698DA3|nr:hypothetical protein [Cryobacterium sp. TMT4-10]TFD17867.1 hypothetical protein E3T42_06975 [Cryobacterium sp. TMT4-10]
MGWKELAASLFASLVTLGWPVAVVVIVLVLLGKFRAEFAALIGRLRKAKWAGAGLDLHFEERVAEVEESAEQVVVEEKIPEAPPAPRSSTIEPVAAMILAYEKLGTQLADLYEAVRPHKTWPQARKNPDGSVQSTAHHLNQLTREGMISLGAFNVISELRHLRNAVVHGRVLPDAAQAAQFLDAADDMQRYIAEQTRKVEGSMFDAALDADSTRD